MKLFTLIFLSKILKIYCLLENISKIKSVKIIWMASNISILLKMTQVELNLSNNFLNPKIKPMNGLK